MNKHEHAGHMLGHAKQGNTGMNTYEHAELMLGHAKQLNTVLFFRHHGTLIIEQVLFRVIPTCVTA
jgi:hypothetical protein